MAKSTNYEDMSLDELIEFRVGQKQEIMALREEYDRSGDVYKKKVYKSLLDEAVARARDAAKASGVTIRQQISEWAENGDLGQRRQANLIATNIDSLSLEE